MLRPAIVDEKVRVDKVVEVQPVIHREIEQPVVRHVEQHIVEPAAPNVGGTVKKAPIIEEHVHTTVVEGTSSSHPSGLLAALASSPPPPFPSLPLPCPSRCSVHLLLLLFIL